MPLGCKEELIKSQEQNEHLTALVGKVTASTLFSTPSRGKKAKKLGLI